ncbi:MAG: hypothetical protein US53_C0027G0002 [Candidatus Woesebacteria bacterium GW2011_GWA1_37_7]|uniref:Uncharacterized protein n=1 Tax=Candidatus Woesebacteria bacterium GW2011_GWA1_37_7 TaxID=1618545 RepID=A0A0G0H4S6_9BACT|nr:MAG: hypothetical protein US53_C0027G0002 [Candidatus Woesebacteria bacterium GW2011_GWA1_37_7]
MFKSLKIVLLITFLSLTFVVLKNPTTIHASEGTFDIVSTTPESYRCFATSLLRDNNKFKLIFSCRDLLYPPDEDLFEYIMWANLVSETKPQKLGTLGRGRGEFEVGKPFSELYVTIEKNGGVNQPQGPIVMSGVVKSIDLLDPRFSPSPTSVEGEPEISEAPKAQQLSTRDKLIIGLRRAGLVALFALIALIGLIFVLTRSRG